jgi:uncharacterized protein
MPLDILITVIVVSFIQSLFGVGVLLFGTPLLLLQGHEFVEALMVLLPISLTINLLQVARHYQSIDIRFYTRILVYSVPLVVVFLLVVTKVKINVSLLIGVFLLAVAAKDHSTRLNRAITLLVKHERAYCAVMGAIHGLTNLGGSLLTAVVHSKRYEKHVARATVAISYATFALFQMLTLLVSGNRLDIGVSGIAFLCVGITVFVLTEAFVFADLRSSVYSRCFAALLVLSGVLLCAKSI